VSQLVWDYAESGDVVDINSYVDVQVTGGIRPLSWKVRGKGFWTDPQHTKRDAVTVGGSLRIYTDEEACGTAAVYATDGCSGVSEYIKSIAGEWVIINKYNDPQSFPPPEEVPYQYTRSTGIGTLFGAVKGKYKYEGITHYYQGENETCPLTMSESPCEVCSMEFDDLIALITPPSNPEYISHSSVAQYFIDQTTDTADRYDWNCSPGGGDSRGIICQEEKLSNQGPGLDANRCIRSTFAYGLKNWEVWEWVCYET